MPARSIDILFASETLRLLAGRAIHWPARQTLILADVHLGKDASFRVAGVPVPAGNSAKDLARIESLLRVTESRRLVILGDLVHARASHQQELADAFAAWRAAHDQLDILLIGGNHDRHAGATPKNWRITQVSEPHDEVPLAFSHYPREHDAPLLCGHVHPTIPIRDFDRSYANLPCFVVEQKTLMLPAFGSFTGGAKTDRADGRKIFAVTDQSVVAVP